MVSISAVPIEQEMAKAVTERFERWMAVLFACSPSLYCIIALLTCSPRDAMSDGYGYAVVPLRDTMYMLFCLVQRVCAVCEYVVDDQL